MSQFAADSPDGLERVALDNGFAEQSADQVIESGPFADYATSGISNRSLSLALAGAAGALVTFAVGFGMLSATRGRRLAPNLR